MNASKVQKCEYEGLYGITLEWLFAHNCVTAIVPQNPGTRTEQKHNNKWSIC